MSNSRECDALDISLISEKQDLSIYPNPVKEEFHILSKSKIHNVLIYDMTGKCVKSFKDKAAYSIHGLQSGVYFVEIQTNEKTYSAKLFIQ